MRFSVKRPNWSFFLVATVILLALFNELWAQSYRNAVVIPPVQVYESMLNFVDRKEYLKVVASLKVLAPIVSHITAKFTDDPTERIKKAINSGDPDEILLSVQTLIILDIKDLLDEALQQVEQSPDVSKTQVKAARLSYELLSPYVIKKDSAADQKIKQNFAESDQMLGSQSPLVAEKAKNISNQLKRLLIDIVFNLSKVFPAK